MCCLLSKKHKNSHSHSTKLVNHDSVAAWVYTWDYTIGLFVEMEIIPAYRAYRSTFRRHHPKCVHKITIQEWQTAGLFHCWRKLVSPRVFDTSPDEMLTTKTFSNSWPSISFYRFSAIWSVVVPFEESGPLYSSGIRYHNFWYIP